MMGKVFSYFKRPFINYAVEERAYRVVDKSEKPKPAPFYPTEDKILKRIQKEHPELLGKIKAKSEKLDDHLKRIKVTSTLLPEPDSLPPPYLEEGGMKSNLPKYRFPHDEQEYGLPELPIEKIPQGKISFRQAMEIFKKIGEDSNLNEAEKLAASYKLNVDKINAMLQHFRPFSFIGDAVPKRSIPKTKKQTFPEVIQEGLELKYAQEQRAIESREQVQLQINKLNKDIDKEKKAKEEVKKIAMEDKIKK